MFTTLRSAVAREAVAAAFAAFAPRHPAYIQNLFDEHFLQSQVAPLLRAPGAAAALTPEWLAGAWAAQFGGHSDNQEHLVAQAIPVAADFIDQLIRALVPPSGSLLALDKWEVA
jgi:hypothetical protein